MTEQTPLDDDASDKVVSLGRAPQPVAPEPPPRGGLHRLAISGMATCALVGIASMLAFITVSWPGETGRYLIAVLVGAVVGFMTCASLAVFSAARETYTVRANHDEPDE